MSYERHALSAVYGNLPPDEMVALICSVKEHGLRQPIVIFEGTILDGWQRLYACNKVGVEPVFEEYVGNDPAALVEDLNNHRRHDTIAQRAMTKVEVNKWRDNGVRWVAKKGGPNEPPQVGGQNDPPQVVDNKGKSNEQMAAEAKVSVSSIKDAKAIVSTGTEELKAATKAGTIALREAARLARKPKAEQDKELEEKKTGKPRQPRSKAPKPTPLPPDMVPKAELEAAQEAYVAIKENRDDIAAELEGCEAVRTGEAVVRFKQIQLELRLCRWARDEAMTKIIDLSAQCAWWKKQAVKLGFKKEDAQP